MTDHVTPRAADFDDAVHQPNRLAILVVLHEAGRADFRYLKQTLGLTDGNLGRYLATLEEYGLIGVRGTPPSDLGAVDAFRSAGARW